MSNHFTSPQSVLIVHERQIVEVTRRREHARLAGPRSPSALRLAIGAALVRAGRAIGNEPVSTAPVVPIRPGIRVV